MIEIIPDWHLLLWIILFSWVADGFFRIILGASGADKSATYGVVDVIAGCLVISVVVAVFIW